MTMVGTVAFVSSARRLALITPIGRSRDCDILAADIWWHVAGIDLPYIGQAVEFEVSPDRDGKLEAVRIRAAAATEKNQV